MGPVDLGDGLEARGVQDRELGHVVRQLFGLGLNEHIAREEGVPGADGDDPNRQTVARIGAGKAVLNPDIAVLQIGLETAEHVFEGFGRYRLVDITPPDVALGFFFLDDELVFGGAAGVKAGAGDDWAAVGDVALAVLDDVLVEKGVLWFQWILRTLVMPFLSIPYVLYRRSAVMFSLLAFLSLNTRVPQ